MNDQVRSADRGPAVRWGPIASYLGVVRSMPFEARYEWAELTRDKSDASSEERVTGAIYRDSAGRVRREYRTQVSTGEALELAVIVDLAARTVVALDIAAKAATRFTDMGPPPGREVPVTGWGYSGPWSLGTGPEERVIEGVACSKARPVAWPLGSALDPKVAGEIWVSDELKFSVLERVSDSGVEHTWRLYNIERTEPASSLFVVPDGYTEVVKSKFSDPPPKL